MEDLQREYQECWNTYMYCEAADFMSSEEKATSARMSRRMGEIRKELAVLRGPGVLDDGSALSIAQAVQAGQPLARLGADVFRQVYPHSAMRSVDTESPADQVFNAVSHGVLTKEQVTEAVLEASARLPYEAAPDDPEVRKEAAGVVARCLDGGSAVYPDLEAVLQVAEASRNPLGAVVAELVRSGRVDLTSSDVNASRRCIYEAGQLGRLAASLAERPESLQRMAALFDTPGLPISEEERRTALAAVGEHLVRRKAGKALLEQWQARGLTAEDVKRGVVGPGAAPAGAIEEGLGWVLVGDVQLPTRP